MLLNVKKSKPIYLIKIKVKKERRLSNKLPLGMFLGYHLSSSPDIWKSLVMPDLAISQFWDILANLLKTPLFWHCIISNGCKLYSKQRTLVSLFTNLEENLIKCHSPEFSFRIKAAQKKGLRNWNKSSVINSSQSSKKDEESWRNLYRDKKKLIFLPSSKTCICWWT